MCKVIESKSEKMKLVASQWKALSDEERAEWQSRAKTVERVHPSMLSEADKNKEIVKSKKRLIQEVSYTIYSLAIRRTHVILYLYCKHLILNLSVRTWYSY